MRLIATFALTMTALLLFDASAQPLTGPPADPQLKFSTPMPPVNGF